MCHRNFLHKIKKMITRFINYFLLGLLFLGSSAQAQQWTRIIDAPVNTITNNRTPLIGYDVQATADGGYFMLGLEQQPMAIFKQFPVLTKVDANGYIQWQKRYFMDLFNSANFNTVALLVGVGDTALIAGLEGDSVRATQVDAQGDTLWRRNYPLNCSCSPDEINLALTSQWQLCLGCCSDYYGGCCTTH